MSSPKEEKAKIQVFWQPGCSSCLRTKEFLEKQHIEFESIDVLNDPGGLEKLHALGARSVPVVALAGKYTFCQSFNDVIRFLDLKTKMLDPLPPQELVYKINLVLLAAQRLARQFHNEQFVTDFKNRNRSPRGLSYHIFKVAQMGVEAAHQKELLFEGFNETAPSEWSAEQIVAWGETVRLELLAWWHDEPQKELLYLVPTYYGSRTMHDVLERTAWHAAQHTRQLAFMLESYGVQPNQALTQDELSGLPVPDAVWDR
jgi:glutaredoxin